MEYFSATGGWQQGFVSKLESDQRAESCFVKNYSGEVRLVHRSQIRKVSGFAHPLRLHEPVAEQGMHHLINVQDVDGRTMLSYAQESNPSFAHVLQSHHAEVESERNRRFRENMMARHQRRLSSDDHDHGSHGDQQELDRQAEDSSTGSSSVSPPACGPFAFSNVDQPTAEDFPPSSHGRPTPEPTAGLDAGGLKDCLVDDLEFDHVGTLPEPDAKREDGREDLQNHSGAKSKLRSSRSCYSSSGSSSDGSIWANALQEVPAPTPDPEDHEIINQQNLGPERALAAALARLGTDQHPRPEVQLAQEVARAPFHCVREDQGDMSDAEASAGGETTGKKQAPPPETSSTPSPQSSGRALEAQGACGRSRGVSLEAKRQVRSDAKCKRSVVTLLFYVIHFMWSFFHSRPAE